MPEQTNGNGASGNRLTWAIVGAGACSVIVVGAFQAWSYLLTRMDAVLDRVGANERLTAEHEGWIDAQRENKP